MTSTSKKIYFVRALFVFDLVVFASSAASNASGSCMNFLINLENDIVYSLVTLVIIYGLFTYRKWCPHVAIIWALISAITLAIHHFQTDDGTAASQLIAIFLLWLNICQIAILSQKDIRALFNDIGKKEVVSGENITTQ
jgi:hypothetical protein